MNKAALDRKDKRLAEVAASWGARSHNRVLAGVTDAENAAYRAITRAVKDAKDGRNTIAAMRQSRGYATAEARLKTLAADLLDLALAAREALYTDAYTGWAAAYPREVVVHALAAQGPPAARVKRFRAEPIQGITLRDEVDAPVSAAIRTLTQTLALAGSRTVASADADDLVEGWAGKVREALLLAMSMILADAMVRADYVASRDAMRPELLHDDPTMPA